MTKQAPKLPKRLKNKQVTPDESLGLVGFVFAITGLGLFATDTTGISGTVFIVIGVVFLASSGWNIKKDKSSKKK